jgi:hypothetical protein
LLELPVSANMMYWRDTNAMGIVEGKPFNIYCTVKAAVGGICGFVFGHKKWIYFLLIFHFKQTMTAEPQTTEPVASNDAFPARTSADVDREDVGLLPKTRVVVGQDGVFANMSQKPQQDKPIVEELNPPSYEEIDSDDEQNPPTYYDTSITCISEDGEVLIEGFPVGECHSFIMNMFVSMAFDLLGFLITMLFSTCHASKFGSQVGLGFTMMRFGLEFKLKADGRIPIDEPFNPNIDPEEVSFIIDIRIEKDVNSRRLF